MGKMQFGKSKVKPTRQAVKRYMMHGGGGFINSKYVEFGGTDEYADFTQVTFTGDFSISLWANGPSFTDCFLLSATTWTDGVFRITDSTNIYFRVNGVGRTIAINTTTLQVDTWHHFVVKRTGTTLYLYVDGQLQSATGVSAGNNCELIHMARRESLYTTLKLDEVAFFDGTALSDANALVLYGGGTPQTAGDSSLVTGITAYWKMGDGDTFQTLLDSVGTNHATMNNMESGDIKSY